MGRSLPMNKGTGFRCCVGTVRPYGGYLGAIHAREGYPWDVNYLPPGIDGVLWFGVRTSLAGVTVDGVSPGNQRRPWDLRPRALLAIPEDAFTTRMQLILEKGQAIFESEDRFTDGSFRPVEVHGRALNSGEQVLICSVARDISERKEAEDTIERVAYYDPLTGLANRRLFNDRLHMALAHSRRTHDPLAVLFLDLDQLKAINDSLGHRSGDEVLRAMAERLQGLVREADTLARLGGDEFVLLLIDAEDRDVLSVAGHVLEAVRTPVLLDGERVNVTVSVGIATSSGGAETAEILLQQADMAMYAVKSTGGNGYRPYQHEMTTAAVARFHLRNDLRDAFERRDFRLCYQPLLRLSDRVVVGAEALLRWRHPTLGEVSPAVFIPPAEEIGLILPPGAWVLQQACQQAQAWREVGLPLERMAVNVSGRQLLQGDLVTDTIWAGYLPESPVCLVCSRLPRAPRRSTR